MERDVVLNIEGMEGKVSVSPKYIISVSEFGKEGMFEIVMYGREQIYIDKSSKVYTDGNVTSIWETRLNHIIKELNED